jgi:hypothetical protein
METLLTGLRLEEERAGMLMIQEEEKEQRILQKKMKQSAWRLKFRWLEEGQLSNQFAKMGIREEYEMMDVESWDGPVDDVEVMEVNVPLEEMTAKMGSKWARRSRRKFLRRMEQIQNRVNLLGMIKEQEEGRKCENGLNTGARQRGSRSPCLRTQEP